jgi:hypothetical protein
MGKGPVSETSCTSNIPHNGQCITFSNICYIFMFLIRAQKYAGKYFEPLWLPSFTKLQPVIGMNYRRSYESNTAIVMNYKRHPLGNLTHLLGHRGTVLSLLFVAISICLLLQKGKLRARICDLICMELALYCYFFFPFCLLPSLLFNHADHDYRVAPHKEVLHWCGNVFKKKLRKMGGISFDILQLLYKLTKSGNFHQTKGAHRKH